jgi:sulfite exporter TauE/SafE
MRIVWLLAYTLIGVGVAAIGWATGQLADGVREIPSHWWSTLACAPLAVGVALAAVSWRLHPRRA